MRIPVERHVFDIPQRLKEIDAALSVVYDTRKRKYDVMGVDLRGPYILTTTDTLDARTVASVRKGYFIANNTGAPWKALLRQQAEDDYLAERERQKGVKDLNDRFHDDMRFAGQSVVQGWRTA